MDLGTQRLMMAAGGGGGSLIIDDYYPMFAIKAFNEKGTGTTPVAPPSANTETPMRRALSFDTTNTTELDGSETISTICSILDTSKYTCNPTFKDSTTTLSAIRIMHYSDSSTLYGYGHMAFNGSAFNIYDHACNATPEGVYGLPSAMGSITNAEVWYSGLSSISVANTNVYVNCSSHNTGGGTTANWTSDAGDYCFLGVSDKHHETVSSDAFDKEFATNRGIAFGISDSDGLYGTKPKDGIGRRGTGYASLVTDWRKKDGNQNSTHDASQAFHSGNTGSGYWIVQGRVKSV